MRWHCRLSLAKIERLIASQSGGNSRRRLELDQAKVHSPRHARQATRVDLIHEAASIVASLAWPRLPEDDRAPHQTVTLTQTIGAHVAAIN